MGQCLPSYASTRVTSTSKAVAVGRADFCAHQPPGYPIVDLPLRRTPMHTVALPGMGATWTRLGMPIGQSSS